MKELMKYITYFMAVVGVVGVIYEFGFMMASERIRVKMAEKTIKEIQINELKNIEFRDSVMCFTNSISGKVDFIKDKLIITALLVNAIRISYINYMLEDSSLTSREFYNYMEGMEINSLKELKEVDTISYKISIKKKVL